MNDTLNIGDETGGALWCKVPKKGIMLVEGAGKFEFYINGQEMTGIRKMTVSVDYENVTTVNLEFIVT